MLLKNTRIMTKYIFVKTIVKNMITFFKSPYYTLFDSLLNNSNNKSKMYDYWEEILTDDITDFSL